MRFTEALFLRFKDIGEVTKKYANLPDSFIKRSMEMVEYKTPRGFPQYLPRTLKKKEYYFGVHRPWTSEFKIENQERKRKVYVEPTRDWSYFRGDVVEILSGKDKGKQGTIVQVIQERNWVIVEGLNCKLEKTGETADSPGMYLKVEEPLLVKTEVELIDPADLLPTKVEWRYTEEGLRVRVSTRSGRIIPVPIQSAETYDYKTKNTYIESEKDTNSDETLKITFEPKLETFEMCIMREMGIIEERTPAPTYWY